jgi:predicted metalloprotease with PDZ domain
MRWLLSCLVLVSCVPVPEPEPAQLASPQPAAPISASTDGIHHILRFADRKTHYIEIETTITEPSAELMMAVWTPGSYLVREYARNIESLNVVDQDGARVTVTRETKNRWRLTGEQQAIRVSYRLYCHELSVRTNWVDSDFAILNGAATFLVPVDQLHRPHTVSLELPEGWSAAKSGMPLDESQRFVAADFDTLVDSPIVAGNPEVRRFDVNSVPHEIVYIGGDGLWDFEKTTADVQRLTSTIGDFWRVPLPYSDYTYLNVIAESQGGLEHKNSTLMLSSRWKTDSREEYLVWLGLVSHEFFHTWNVKRLRPKALGPFDYEAEVYTPSLWIAEGITSYYDDLLIARAGLVDQSEYLELLSKHFVKLHKAPGRLVHPLAQTSQDAWIKFYRKDENFKNSSVSYYVKGAVVAFLLDAEIRAATVGAKSLDDVMRTAYLRFSGERGFETEEFRAIASEVAGIPLDDFFRHTIDSAEELDYSKALAWYGLRFPAVEPPTEGSLATLGVELGGASILHIPSDGPAHGLDLQVNDELIAINDFRLEHGALEERLKRYAVGEQVELLIARRGKLRRISLTLGEREQVDYSLELDPDATGLQLEHLEALIRENRAQ